MDPPSFKIFLSYRRGDTAGWVDRLVQDLVGRYGPEAVFFDRTEIEPGAAFPYEIQSAVTGASLVLVVIGKSWLTIQGDDGQRRLDDPEDWVAAEVELALAGSGEIVPVLVEDATMPEAADLPASIQTLAGRQAAELSPNRWQEDLRRLKATVDRCLKGKRRRPPLRWALAAALGAFALGMLAWVTDLAGVPGIGWPQRVLERSLARQVPAVFDRRIALVAIDEGTAADAVALAQRRRRYAELFATLADSGASVAALDAYFDWDLTPEPDDTDRALVRAIEARPPKAPGSSSPARACRGRTRRSEPATGADPRRRCRFGWPRRSKTGGATFRRAFRRAREGRSRRSSSGA